MIAYMLYFPLQGWFLLSAVVQHAMQPTPAHAALGDLSHGTCHMLLCLGHHLLRGYPSLACR